MGDLVAPPWLTWIANLGHDTYSYPWWVSEQQRGCECKVWHDGLGQGRVVSCLDRGVTVSWRAAVSDDSSNALSYCLCKAWLLEHMPEFDMHFLPNGVAVNATSMLDDVIAFALMADKAAPWAASFIVHVPVLLCDTL